MKKHEIEDVAKQRLQNNAAKALKFVTGKKDYNDSLVFLIDMKIPIRKNRFFVYNLKQQKVVDLGLVAHGDGSHKDNGDLVFSNVNNSHCTSLGKYSVGVSYVGKYGKSYKLHGLDETNSNAFDRNIVLHAYEDMPSEENTDPVYLSFGCPMVSTKFFKRLEPIIDSSDKKILLWIYY
ncbi:murein L,D-transpeptidase catalytic domain-containing protein [Flavobacterium silvaticum]|uniref:murein L,D-transpeptidase catalytic domain-containing protein n=1 Tax=Flavobacterium silvaticum TaxID=1852020 RepID=UPI00293BEB65|nr:murein L,D-transpeptidase catalytic domain family protein [Flavobacterium silvaticum]